MGVRLELQPEPHGKRTHLPPACHTLSKSEKISFWKDHNIHIWKTQGKDSLWKIWNWL